MLYISTRGHASKQRFCDISLEGLAPDGGLYLPTHYPALDAQQLGALRQVFETQGYAHLAFEILRLYIDDIPTDDLRALCQKTYTADVFGSPLIAPVRPFEKNVFILEDLP